MPKFRRNTDGITLGLFIRYMKKRAVDDYARKAHGLFLSMYGPIGYMRAVADPTIRTVRLVGLDSKEHRDKHGPCMLKIEQNMRRFFELYREGRISTDEVNRFRVVFNWQKQGKVAREEVVEALFADSEAGKIAGQAIRLMADSRVFSARREARIAESVASAEGNILLYIGGRHIGPVSKMVEEREVAGLTVQVLKKTE